MSSFAPVAPSITLMDLRVRAREVGVARGFAAATAITFNKGVKNLLDWLLTYDAPTWQDRWLLAEPDIMDWENAPHVRGRRHLASMRMALLALMGLRLIRPTYTWLNAQHISRLHVSLAAGTDVADFARVNTALKDLLFPGWKVMSTRFCLALILVHTGKTLSQLDHDDLIEYEAARKNGKHIQNTADGLHDVVLHLGIIKNSPSYFSWPLVKSDDGLEKVVDRYGPIAEPFRSVFLHFLRERRSQVSISTVKSQAGQLLRHFWHSLENHNSTRDMFKIPYEITQQWKRKARQHADSEQRKNAKKLFTVVRNFYKFLARMGIEDSENWKIYVAACPVSLQDITAERKLETQSSTALKNRIVRLMPHIKTLREVLKKNYINWQEVLAQCQVISRGEPFEVDGRRFCLPIESTTQIYRKGHGHHRFSLRDLSKPDAPRISAEVAEERAFWLWTSTELMLGTGMRPAELFRLKRTDIDEQLDEHGERVPCLHITAGKTDFPRVVSISPEVLDVLAAIIDRVQGTNPTHPLVDRFNSTNEEFEMRQPMMMQKRYGTHLSGFSAGELGVWLNEFFTDVHSSNLLDKRIRFELKDCRRIFATKLHLNKVSILTICKILGHRSVEATMRYIATDEINIQPALNGMWDD